MLTPLYFYYFAPSLSIPLEAPVLSFVYATVSTIRLAWTDAIGGSGPYTYSIQRDSALHASDQTSPYDDSTSLLPATLYSYSVTVTDAVGATAQSNIVTAALPFDGSGGGGIDVTDGDTLRIIKGDDHTEGDRLPRWNVLEYTGPSMSGASGMLRLLRLDRYRRKDADRHAELEVDAQIIQTGSILTITAPITSDETELLRSSPIDEPTHEYQIIGTTSGGKPHTIKMGPVIVTRNIEAEI